MDPLGDDIPDVHVVVYLQRLRDDVGAVKLLVNYAAAYGVSVKTYQEVKKRSSVFYDQFLITVDGAQYLLGKVE